jgi:hypothetical protein
MLHARSEFIHGIALNLMHNYALGTSSSQNLFDSLILALSAQPDFFDPADRHIQSGLHSMQAENDIGRNR